MNAPIKLTNRHRLVAAQRKLAEANEELSVVQLRDYPAATKKMLAQKAWNARMKALNELHSIDIE